ncbi:MAG: tetratricopeptide repeat protein [Spirochaetaceae bacterium]|nr:MAG: tetratricopeptide repeat protein [Spirochaetaceae bacterium]
MKSGMYPFLVALLLLMGTLSGCNAFGPHFLTIRANYNVSRGEYQLAIVDYLRAGEGGQFDRWLAYNLGNVYHFLGESNAAVERWDYARAVDSQDLVLNASFNRGVYFFEQGQYREARRHFRTALEIDPANGAAKRNFELALERIAAETDLTGDAGQSGRAAEAPPVEAARSTDGGSRMLDYMRRREEQRWRASQQLRVSPDVEDW